MSEPEQDQRCRLAAVEHVKRIGLSDSFSSDDLYAGFTVDGTRIPLTNPQRGIFKPTQMRYLLRVKTVFPRSHRLRVEARAVSSAAEPRRAARHHG